MKEMTRYGVILAVICFSAALILSITHHFTQSAVEAKILAEQNLGLKEVLVGAESFTEKNIGPIVYYEAKSKNNLVGFVLKVEARGYSGPIEMLAGLDLNGQIAGIKVLSQSETPGLGSRIIEIRRSEDKPWFLKQFEGRRPEDLNLKNISAITSATITSKAVIDSVREKAKDFLAKIQKQ